MKKMDDPSDELFLRVLRPLVETYDAVMEKDETHIRTLGFSQTQFDVIVTLGDTKGMTRKKIEEEILITKGTITDALVYLETKGLIENEASEEGEGAEIVRLTEQGEACFKTIYPKHIHYLKPFFEHGLTPLEMASLRALLRKLKKSFETE